LSCGTSQSLVLCDYRSLAYHLEFRNVSFSYPGAKKTTNALNDVSLSIKAGQLVVIVGANGSGKSTIIKLLSRLYDPSSGTLLIDDVPAVKYLASNLRRATASFTQDHKLFPLSLYENIGLGHPAHLSDKVMVAQAAELGGASEFIGKLADGLQTVLEPNHDVNRINVPPDLEHPLRKKIQMLEKEQDISGGERQRVIAYVWFLWNCYERVTDKEFDAQIEDVHAPQFWTGQIRGG
jgi:ABC-type multidrug transport system fused ATPase/permease subunit